MNAYFDTSALIKNYIEELGTKRVGTVLQEVSGVLVSVVTAVECASVLSRLKSEGALTELQVRIALKEIGKDYPFFDEVELDSEVREIAHGLVLKRGLKTLDSIQLASAMARKAEVDLFLASDRKLLGAAKGEGFKIENPVRGKS